MNKKKIFEKVSPLTIYLLVSLTGIILFFCAAYFKGSPVFKWLAMENNSDWTMSDYFRHLLFARDRATVYEHGDNACFPPLAYVFYYVYGKISSAGEVVNNFNVLSQMPYQILMYVLYSVVSVLLLVYAIEELPIKKYLRRLLAFSVILSTPLFMGALERGNMTLIVIALLLLAMLWKDSESAVKREAALILIAVAAGLKIYPAFFGLLYIKEKRWKEAARLVVYGVLFFFGPFAFFGGVSGFKAFWSVISSMLGGNPVERVQFFTGILAFVGIQGKTAQILNYVFLIVLFLMVLFTKSNIRKMAFLAAAMAFFPNAAFRYTLLYFLMPLFVLCMEHKKLNFDSVMNALFLGYIFSIPTIYGFLTDFQLAFSENSYSYTCVERNIYTAAWLYLLYQVIMEVVFWGKTFIQKRKSAQLNTENI